MPDEEPVRSLVARAAAELALVRVVHRQTREAVSSCKLAVIGVGQYQLGSLTIQAVVRSGCVPCGAGWSCLRVRVRPAAGQAGTCRSSAHAVSWSAVP